MQPGVEEVVMVKAKVKAPAGEPEAAPESPRATGSVLQVKKEPKQQRRRP